MTFKPTVQFLPYLREGQRTEKKKITLLLSQWKISKRKERERKSSMGTKGKAAVCAQKLSALLELPGCSLLLDNQGTGSSSPSQHKVLLAQGHRSELGTTEREQREA